MLQSMSSAHSISRLDEAHAAFVQFGGSINVGARDNDGQPFVARAVGCRVSHDRRRVTVFLPEARSVELLEHVGANGCIVVVFNRTTTHEALQIKGDDAVVGELEAGDADLVEAYRQAFCDELAELGHRAEFTHALLGDPSERVVAVSFTPNGAFQQTPGPRAGRPLETRS